MTLPTKSTWHNNDYVNAIGLIKDFILYRTRKKTKYIWHILD